MGENERFGMTVQQLVFGGQRTTFENKRKWIETKEKGRGLWTLNIAADIQSDQKTA